MSEIHKIISYPVGNGDTTQVVLSSGTRILLDFCHTNNAEKADDSKINLDQALREELSGDERDYFDVVAFTHADADHIGGSTEFFELEHAQQYQGDDRIKIRQLWVPAAMLLEEAERDKQSEEFVILRQEARHRLLEGQGILVFSKPQELLGWLEPKLEERGLSPRARDHLFVDAGSIVPGFQLETDGVEFFCHSPFIKHCEDGDQIRNIAALVFNIRFQASGFEYDYLHFGDAPFEVIEDIVAISKYHDNLDRLEWNLFNIPHHCSYKSLSDEKGIKETKAEPLVQELLLLGRADSYMISSSLPNPDIADSYIQVQPPHIQARNSYSSFLTQVGGRKLLVTMEEPNAAKPKPLIFEISSGGITWKRILLAGAPALIAARPPRAGA